MNHILSFLINLSESFLKVDYLLLQKGNDISNVTEGSKMYVRTVLTIIVHPFITLSIEQTPSEFDLRSQLVFTEFFFFFFGENLSFFRRLTLFYHEAMQIKSQMSIRNRSQLDYCKVCCEEEELETVKHLHCNCLALSKLRLRTLGRGLFKSLNSVSRTDISTDSLMA